MIYCKRYWAWLLYLGVQLALAADVQRENEDPGTDIGRRSSDVNFFAARGRRSSEKGATGSPNDFFWANRGKKWSSQGHAIGLRDKSYNAPRPNGFFFPTKFGNGKRGSTTFNIPRPNGFFFPSSSGKRNSYNIPKPNGFFFPSMMTKRSDFNLPRPNGFMFPTKKQQDKRSGGDQEGSEVEEVVQYFQKSGLNLPKPTGFFWPGMVSKKAAIRPWNVAEPNGFFFPALPQGNYGNQKRTYEDYENMLMGYLSEIVQDEMESHMSKRSDNVDLNTFFAGRGKRTNQDDTMDLDAFFGSRGKKADEADVDMSTFFAGIGKKAPPVNDIFFAGRGKRSADVRIGESS